MNVSIYLFQLKKQQVENHQRNRRTEKKKKEIEELNTINQLDLINIYRTFTTITAERIFFASLHEAITNIDHILGQKFFN